MITVIYTATALIVGIPLFYWAFSMFVREFRKAVLAKKTPTQLCRASSVDCFPSRTEPGVLCENGCCIIHCVCLCNHNLPFRSRGSIV